MSPNTGKTKKHTNDEREVKCPVEGCDAEKLARGIHLHVRRSSGNGHGPQNEIPEELDMENLETVGTREVEMDYPEERDSEKVARLCPYCERPYRGKHGVMIHLGQTAGRKNHPKNPKEKHNPEDFKIVHVDENENVIEKVDEEASLPTTERRQERESEGEMASLDPSQVEEYIGGLREQGLDEEAERAEKMLLGK